MAENDRTMDMPKHQALTGKGSQARDESVESLRGGLESPDDHHGASALVANTHEMVPHSILERPEFRRGRDAGRRGGVPARWLGWGAAAALVVGGAALVAWKRSSRR